MAGLTPTAQEQLVSPNGIFDKYPDNIAPNCLTQKSQVHWQIKNHSQALIGFKGKDIGIYPWPNQIRKLASAF
jgi:hypothetical protein